MTFFYIYNNRYNTIPYSNKNTLTVPVSHPGSCGSLDVRNQNR